MDQRSDCRAVLKYLLPAVVLALAMTPAAAEPPGPLRNDPSNVVLIVTDDQGSSSTSASHGVPREWKAGSPRVVAASACST